MPLRSAQRDNLLKQCDCEPARWPKCPHSWHVVAKRQWVSLDRHCKLRGLPLVRTRGEAEKLRDEIVPLLEAGTYEKKPTAKPVVVVGGKTFDEAWPLFVKAELGDYEDESCEAERQRYRRLADIDVPDLGRAGALSLTAFTEVALLEVFKQATKGHKAGTKIKYRRCLRRLFKWALLNGHIEKAPLVEWRVLKCAKSDMRTQRVAAEWERRLLQAASSMKRDPRVRELWWLEALFMMALDLGLRRGELLALQWRDILWDSSRVYVRAEVKGARKNRKPRRVPLRPRVMDWLRRLAESNPTGKEWNPSDYVFGTAIGGPVTIKRFRRMWLRCVALAFDIEVTWAKGDWSAETRAAFAVLNLHFHDLRHECAHRWLERRYTLPTIAKLLGHSNLDTLKVYLGLDEETALEEAERINAELDGGPDPAAEGPAGSKRAVKQAGARQLILRKGRQVAVGE